MDGRAPDDNPVPSWDRVWQGRFEAELDALRTAGVGFTVDQALLASGRLEMEIAWPHRGRTLHLKASYPESFPWTRPMVFLIAAPADLPKRHCSPTDGQLCLLGRDSSQWEWGWTLQELLERQLPAAMNDVGDQDPQAEPMEVWWNGLSAEEAGHCLVDSAWAPGSPGTGHVTLRFAFEAGGTPRMRACAVAFVKPGATAAFDTPVNGLVKSADVPWVHLAEAPVPEPEGRNLHALISKHFELPQKKPIVFDMSHQGSVFAISYPMEVSYGVEGTGWLFVVATAERLASPRGGRERRGGGAKPRANGTLAVLQTLRAGVSDMSARDPSAAALAGKRVVVVGAGSIGAPIALGLARSGVRVLDIVDHDRVEPGNGVRWVGGPSAWGCGKAAALAGIIKEAHPLCEARVHPLMIGAPDAEVAPLLARADVVIDATASVGPGMWLGAECGKRGIPLLMAMAWAGNAVDGGLVALHAPGGGCPHCLQFAQHQGEALPIGGGLREPSLQPPGCGERTFSGASHDLQEISLQALRMVPAALAAPSTSVVATMSFDTGPFAIRLPRWDVRELRTYGECGCSTRTA